MCVCVCIIFLHAELRSWQPCIYSAFHTHTHTHSFPYPLPDGVNRIWADSGVFLSPHISRDARKLKQIPRLLLGDKWAGICSPGKNKYLSLLFNLFFFKSRQPQVHVFICYPFSPESSWMWVDMEKKKNEYKWAICQGLQGGVMWWLLHRKGSST